MPKEYCMKKPDMLASFILLAVLAAVPCSAQQSYKFNLPANDEPIYGTWVNAEYSGWGGFNAQKWVYLNWGFGRLFNLAADEIPSYEWTFIIVEKWADAGGSTLYKLYLQDDKGKEYYLARVSGNRKTLEFVRGAGFPKESDLQPTDSSYRFYRRQQLQEKISNEDAWKKIVGEWVNTEYSGSQPYTQKTVVRPDFQCEDWDKLTDTTPSGVWAAKLNNSWKDEKGYLYCQLSWEYVSQEFKGNKGVQLWRLDPSGKDLEFKSWVTTDVSRFPNTIKENEPGMKPSFYFIYHRK
jgi:hypothetical protein